MNAPAYPRFDALQKALQSAPGWFQAEARNDAGFTPFVSRALEQMLAKEYEVPLEELPLVNGGVIPIDESIDEGAETYRYTVIDGAGIAEFANDYAQGSMPMATISDEEFTRKVFPIEMGYEMSRKDIRAARFARKPIRDRLNRHALRGMLEKHEQLGMWGNEQRDLHGFANHPNVPEIASIGTSWETDSGDSIIDDITNAEEAIRTNTNCTRQMNAIMLPERTMRALTRRDYTSSAGSVVGDGSSIMDRIRQRFPDVAIGSLCRLQADRSMGNLPEDRAVFYVNGDSDIVSYVLPMRPRFYDPQWYENMMKVPGETSTAAVDWREPFTACYMGVGS